LDHSCSAICTEALYVVTSARWPIDFSAQKPEDFSKSSITHFSLEGSRSKRFFFCSRYNLTLKSSCSFLIYLHLHSLSLSLMGNRSRIRLWTTLSPWHTLLYLAFLRYHLTSTAASGSPSPYTPVDDIPLNCGSSGNSTTTTSDGRTWIGDVDSKFFPVEYLQNQKSLIARAVQQSSSAVQVPYATARISFSEFTYIFPVTTGQKFIRLYFYPALYPNFDRSKALFLLELVVLLFSVTLTLHSQRMPMMTPGIPYSENTVSASRRIRG
jgi:hypothetical protein